MAKRSDKQRQKARQKKLEKKKQKRSQRLGFVRPTLAAPRRGLPSGAGEWPLHECLVTKSWRKPGEIVQILIARRGTEGQIAAGSFLMDLGCLGLKDAFGYSFHSLSQYEQFRQQMRSSQPMARADVNLAAKIIREGIAYADRFGFKPHRDFQEAQPILGDADPNASTETVPLGQDGKPLFIAGPYDNVPEIMAKLKRAVGPDGFHFLVPLEPGDMFE